MTAGVGKSISCAVGGDGSNQFFYCGQNEGSDFIGLSLYTLSPSDVCSALTLEAVPICSVGS